MKGEYLDGMLDWESPRVMLEESHIAAGLADEYFLGCGRWCPGRGFGACVMNVTLLQVIPILLMNLLLKMLDTCY
jgi:hypothetical protein